MRSGIVLGLFVLVTTACAPSPECRGDLPIEGCPCTLGGACRDRAECDGARCGVLMCTAGR